MQNFGYTCVRSLFSALAIASLLAAGASFFLGLVWISSKAFGIEVVSWTWAALGLPIVTLAVIVAILTAAFFSAASKAVQSVYRIRQARAKR